MEQFVAESGARDEDLELQQGVQGDMGSKGRVGLAMEQLVFDLSVGVGHWEELHGAWGDEEWRIRVEIARRKCLEHLKRVSSGSMCTGEFALEVNGFEYWQLAMGLEEYSGYQLGCMAHQMDQTMRERVPEGELREAVGPVGSWYARCFGLPKGEEYKKGI